MTQPEFNMVDYARPDEESLIVSLLAKYLPDALVTTDPQPDDAVSLPVIVLSAVPLNDREGDPYRRWNMNLNVSHSDREEAKALALKAHALLQWFGDTVAHIEGLGYVSASISNFGPRRSASDMAGSFYSYTSSTRCTLHV